MFDGIMPPEGLAAAAKDTACSLQSVPLVQGLGTPTEGAIQGVVEKKWATVAPRVLTIAFPLGGVGPASFPPPLFLVGGTFSGSLKSGIVDTSGVPLGGAVTPRAACVLEYGIGAANQKVFFDWKPGAYNVPACEWARVGVLCWGTGFNAGGLVAAASLATGQLHDAYPPTVSSGVSLLAATPVQIRVPGNARTVEVQKQDAATPVISLAWTAAANVFATRNYATGQFVPGWSPLDVQPPVTALFISTDVDCAAYITFELSL